MSLIKRCAAELFGTFWLAPVAGGVIGALIYRALLTSDD